MKFLHVTDTHLVEPGGHVHGLDPAERLRACVSDILAEHADAERVIVTGDIADRAEASAYATFNDVVAALPMPVHVLIGNHDDRETFVRCLAGVETDPGGFVQCCLDTGAGRFLLLDTLDPGRSSGRYCRQRQAWLRDALDGAGGRPVFVFMHHPPFDLGIPGLDRIGLSNRDEFAELLHGRTNIRHLFFGHAHRPISGSWEGIPVSTLCATAHQVALDMRDRGPLRYTHERPSYAVVTIDAHSVLVHGRDFLGPPLAGE